MNPSRAEGMMPSLMLAVLSESKMLDDVLLIASTEAFDIAAFGAD